MKTKLFLQTEDRNRYSPDRTFRPGAIRSGKGLEQQLAERTAEVRKQTDQLRTMASKLAQVEQCERGRLAAILHDNLQQLLVAARIQISTVNPDRLPAKERKALSMANEIIRQAITDSRTLTTDLSPPVLHGASLGVALEWLVGRMAELHLFTVNLSIDDRAEPQSESLRVLLFETVRELLLNSCKYSGCARASVDITWEQDCWARVVVEDAGAGFDPRALSASMASGERLGLFSIQQRLADVGARMTLASDPGVGTRVEILVRTGFQGNIGNRRLEGRMHLGFERKEEDDTNLLVGNDRRFSTMQTPLPRLS